MSSTADRHARQPSDPHRETAEALLRLVGGPANVRSVAHCMTRLRLGLADRARVRDAELRARPEVLGVVEDEDAYQIVLGPGKVARVHTAFEALTAERAAGEGESAADGAGAPAAEGPSPAPSPEALSPAPSPAPGPGAPHTPATPHTPVPPDAPVTADGLAARGAHLRAERKARNATPLKQALRRIADIFVPLIPALIGCGIVAGAGAVLTNLVSGGHAPWAAGVVPALTAISAGFMSLIAVFVGVNTAAEFGGTPVLGGAAAAVIVFADVSKVSAFGAKLTPGQGGVLGALLAALVAVHVERWCRRHVPESADVLVTPTVTVLVSGLVTLFGLMYVCGQVAAGIGLFADWLLLHGGAAAGFLLGGLFLPLVMLGLHQALIPIHTTLIEQNGYTVLLPVLAMAGAGQVGAAVAVYARLRRNASVRRTVKSALPAGLMGVGEPLIYGVSLPLGRPFVTACAGGAVGGGAVGFFHQLGTPVGATAIGPSGWALFPLLKGDQGLAATAAVYGLGLAAGYLAGFLATYFFGFSKQMLTELNTAEPATAPETVVATGGPSRRSPDGDDDEGGRNDGEPRRPIGI